MEKTFCDRCGREMQPRDSETYRTVGDYAVKVGVIFAGAGDTGAPDVCVRCVTELLEKLPA